MIQQSSVSLHFASKALCLAQTFSIHSTQLQFVVQIAKLYVPNWTLKFIPEQKLLALEGTITQ